MKMSNSDNNKLPKSAKAKRFLRPRINRKKVGSISKEKVPRITNDSVSKHREEVIASAKKYIYPLKHSTHRVALISLSILVALFIGFASFTLISLYRFNAISDFAYQVTKAVPLPVGKIGSTFVPYEEYLFELKHYIHYFETQQEVDFSSEEGQRQLDNQRQESLKTVINNAYARKIAKEKGLTVSDQEVEDQINILRSQNRLGNDDQVFEDVLKDYYAWSINDFRRSIKQELLNAKVVKALDEGVLKKAQIAQDEINKGAPFADVAKKYSEDDTTKENGGELGFLISPNDRNIPPQTIAALKNMQPGDVSEIIDLGYELEILRLDALQDDKYKASRIAFRYKELDDYLNDIKEHDPATVYIRVELKEESAGEEGVQPPVPSQ